MISSGVFPLARSDAAQMQFKLYALQGIVKVTYDICSPSRNVPVQRRRYAVAGTGCQLTVFFVALSEALQGVYATIKRGRNGQGS